MTLIILDKASKVCGALHGIKGVYIYERQEVVGWKMAELFADRVILILLAWYGH